MHILENKSKQKPNSSDGLISPKTLSKPLQKKKLTEKIKIKGNELIERTDKSHLTTDDGRELLL